MRKYNVIDDDGNKCVVMSDSRDNAQHYFDVVRTHDFVVSAVRAMAHVFN